MGFPLFGARHPGELLNVEPGMDALPAGVDKRLDGEFRRAPESELILVGEGVKLHNAIPEGLYVGISPEGFAALFLRPGDAIQWIDND